MKRSDILKALMNYIEFGVPNAESINKYFSESPYEHQEELISYMRTCGKEKCVCGLAYDVVNNESLGTRKILNDGTYSWTNDLIYYVEKYNLLLPDDFIQHVLNQISK